MGSTTSKKSDHFVRITPRGEVQAPVEFRDAVEMWARNHGRHADLEFIAPIATWQVRLSPMANDPRLELYKQGKVPYEELWECVQLTQPVTAEDRAKHPNLKGPYRPMNLSEMGVDGLIALLDKGNMWTKRGEFNSIQEALCAARERQVREQEKMRRTLSETVRDIALDVRRRIHEIPFLRVGIDLTPPTGAPESGEV